MSSKTKADIQRQRNSISAANNNIALNEQKVEAAKQKIVESEEEIKVELK